MEREKEIETEKERDKERQNNLLMSILPDGDRVNILSYVS